MHELSISMSIVDLAREEALKNNGKRITEIEIEVGELSGVDADTLVSALSMVVEEGMTRGAVVKLDRVRGEGRCHLCGESYRLKELRMECPYCQSFETEIIRGKELRLKSILIE